MGIKWIFPGGADISALKISQHQAVFHVPAPTKAPIKDVRSLRPMVYGAGLAINKLARPEFVKVSLMPPDKEMIDNGHGREGNLMQAVILILGNPPCSSNV